MLGACEWLMQVSVKHEDTESDQNESSALAVNTAL